MTKEGFIEKVDDAMGGEESSTFGTNPPLICTSDSLDFMSKCTLAGGDGGVTLTDDGGLNY